MAGIANSMIPGTLGRTGNVDDCPDGARPVDGATAVPVTPFTFSLALSLVHGHPGLTVAGDIDVFSAAEFRDAIDLLSDIADGDVLIDMAGVTFLDSMGLHALLGALERLQSQDRRVGLLEPSAVVLRLLELCGVVGRFDVLGRSATPETVFHWFGQIRAAGA